METLDALRVVVIESRSGLAKGLEGALASLGEGHERLVGGQEILRRVLADRPTDLVVDVGATPAEPGWGIVALARDHGAACVVVRPSPRPGVVLALIRSGAIDVVSPDDPVGLRAALARGLEDGVRRARARGGLNGHVGTHGPPGNGVVESSLGDRLGSAGHAATGVPCADPLTGLANHRSFRERLAQEFARAERHRRSLSLALFDIDHLRRLNEDFGHVAGDGVLTRIAGLLRSVAREGDLLARVGGEEIAWLMPETGAADSLQAVERARELVACASFGEVGHVTVSVGVCDLSQAASPTQLVRLAEGALYWAKRHGRDVSFLYTPSVVEELSSEERADRLHRVQALQSIRVLARAVDAKDPSTRQHSERVADLAVALGTALGWDVERLVRLREAGLVHDVGKIGVPDRVLFKEGGLLPDEREEIIRHAAIGAAMVADVLTPEQVSWVRGHHERWDGQGYPEGLAGDAIPDGARVLALADAWDVMTSVRSYHEPLSVADALAECRRCARTQFSADVVRAIERLVGAGAIPAAPFA